MVNVHIVMLFYFLIKNKVLNVYYINCCNQKYMVCNGILPIIDLCMFTISGEEVGREERVEHEDSTKATNDRTQRRRDTKITEDEKMDKEKIEKDPMESMEKVTEDVDSNLLMDEVISNADKSKE